MSTKPAAAQSVGIALTSDVESTETELMHRADIALYAAKAAARDCYRLFDDELEAEIEAKTNLARDLRTALKGYDGLILSYQLKLHRSGKLRGVKAIAGWDHSRHGIISQQLLTEVAEETGLTVTLQDWILHQAVAFANRWPQLQVAVDASLQQLRNPAFAMNALQTLRAACVPTARIELEVKALLFSGEPGVVSRNLGDLRDAGFHLTLDGSGSGVHFQTNGANRFKINSFAILDIDQCKNAVMVEAIVKLAHAMDLEVTAEGVGTDRQLQALIQMGVDELQCCQIHYSTDEPTLTNYLLSRLPLESTTGAMPHPVQA